MINCGWEYERYLYDSYCENPAEYAHFSFFRHIILFVIEHDDCPEVKITGSYCCPDLPGMSECDVDFDY